MKKISQIIFMAFVSAALLNSPLYIQDCLAKSKRYERVQDKSHRVKLAIREFQQKGINTTDMVKEMRHVRKLINQDRYKRAEVYLDRVLRKIEKEREKMAENSEEQSSEEEEQEVPEDADATDE